MTVAAMLAYALRRAACTGALAGGMTGLCLLGALAGLVAGCGGGGAIAPVQSPSQPAIPGRGRDHVVGRGDTLYSIAWRHGLDYRVLAGVNSIRDPYTIYPGQRLLVPEPGDSVPPEPEPATEAREPLVSKEVSARGIGTTQAPAITPLPPSSPELATKPPEQISAQSQPSGPESEPKPLAKTHSGIARKAPARVRQSEPGSKRASIPQLAGRTVAGVRWTRPTSGKTIKGFGRGGNKGVDIEGSFQQPIRAAARGRVVYAGSGLIGYGKLVIVKHDSRILSAYAHNERLHVGEGDEVQGGEHIADMGRSGKGRVMLHFEIRRDGKPVDPLRYLP